MKINKLSIDTSEVIVEGDIAGMDYSDKDLGKDKGGSGFISKIFR